MTNTHTNKEEKMKTINIVDVMSIIFIIIGITVTITLLFVG